MTDGERVSFVGDLPGFAPRIARLVCMMRYARHTTLEAVHDLTPAQLDHLHDRQSNSIGALLHHIAAVEWYYQVVTLEDRRPTSGEEAQWLAALELGDRGRGELRGRPLGFYLHLLEATRARSVEGLRAQDDDWLTPDRHFAWFHVFEDELNHRGQIRWLRGRLPGTATA